MKRLLLLALIITLFVRCKKEDAIKYTLNKDEVTSIAGGSFQLSITGATTEIFTYSSDNSLIASIDANGLIKGKRVGETTIKVSGNNFNGVCKVSISPLYNTFKEPITSFGISKSAVKAKETRTLVNEIDGALLFNGGTQEKYVMYVFENDKLTTSTIIISSSYSSVLGSYLAERYVIVSLSPVLGYSTDNKFAVGTDLQSNLDWWVMYFPYTVSKSKSALIKAKALQFKSIVKNM